ncbi:MAG: hypothetical protein M3T96_07225, partial [Acidobacteriota bacterium]|nr:hypothetical protein [Acidobacteriota bacterium]
MKNNPFAKLFVLFLIVSASFSAVVAQKKRPPVKVKAKPVIFAVLNDGKTIEPFAFIEKGKLTEAAGGDPDSKIFSNAYYKSKPVYRLIFGGVDDGAAAVKTFDPNAECGKYIADVTAAPVKAKLKGLVMALATDAPVKKATGVRRLPTAAERTEVETLVRSEFVKQTKNDNASRDLKYHNLTALDVDGDGKAEIVGSFYLAPSAAERDTLFFIADKGADGKYKFGYSDFHAVKKDDVMSGDLKMLDTG